MAKGKAMVRRAPTVSKAKYEGLARARSAAVRKSKEVASARAGVVTGAVAAYLVGHFEKAGKKLPTVGGIEPTALYGAALAFGVPMFVKGKVGTMAAEAGAAVLGIAAYKAGMGQPMRSVSGDADDDDDGDPD